MTEQTGEDECEGCKDEWNFGPPCRVHNPDYYAGSTGRCTTAVKGRFTVWAVYNAFMVGLLLGVVLMWVTT